MESKKRMRKESGKRWTKEDKNLLLSIIAENPMKFEKPTAQIFYGNIIQQNSQFDEYGWKSMRDKLRNLRASYAKAVDCMKNMDSVLNEKDAETTTRAHILKLCEDFDVLQYIFSCRNVSPFVHDTADICSSPGTTSEIAGEPVEAVQPEDECSYILQPNTTQKKSRLQSNNSTAYLAQVQIDKTTYLREKLEFMKTTKERKLKLEGEKLALEREKIALEREKMKEESRLREMEITNNFELSKMRLEREMALKELELEYKYKK